MDTQFFFLKIKVAVANQTNGNSSCFFIPVLDHYENTESFLFRLKRTLLKIISAVLIAVESFSMAIATVSVFLFAAETPMPNDDITLLMEQNECFGLWLLIISLVGFFSPAALFVQKRPLALIKLYLRNP